MTLTTSELLMFASPIVGAAMAGLMVWRTHVSVLKRRALRRQRKYASPYDALVAQDLSVIPETKNLGEQRISADREAARQNQVVEEALRFARRLNDLAR